jgi:hypothetical protein
MQLRNFEYFVLNDTISIWLHNCEKYKHLSQLAQTKVFISNFVMFQKYVRQNTQEFFFTFLYVYYVQCNEVISYQLPIILLSITCRASLRLQPQDCASLNVVTYHQHLCFVVCF